MIDELDENFAEYENAEIRRGMDLSELTADNFDKIERDDDGTAFGVTGGVPYPLATEIYQKTENSITYDFERRQDGSEWFLGKTGEKQRGISVSLGNVAGEQPGMMPKGSMTRDVQRGLAQGAFDAGKNLNETLPMLGAPVDKVNELITPALEYFGDTFGIDLTTDYPIGGSESIRDGVEALVGFADFLMPDALQQADIAFRAEKPESPIIQEIVKGITEFGVNSVGPAMYLKAFTAMGPFARGLAWGGIADFINAQPDDRTAVASLTEFLTDATPEERSAIANATIDVFAQNGEDPDFINRAKVALDGMVIGGALEKGLELVVRASKQIPWSSLQEATVKAGARADERLASMARGTTLSANPIGAAGDLALSVAGRVAGGKVDLIFKVFDAMRKQPGKVSEGRMPTSVEERMLPAGEYEKRQQDLAPGMLSEEGQKRFNEAGGNAAEAIRGNDALKALDEQAADPAADVVRDAREGLYGVTNENMTPRAGDPQKPPVTEIDAMDAVRAIEPNRVDDLVRAGADGIDFNFDRIETGDDVKAMFNHVSELYKDPIEAAKRGVQTNEMTKEAAEQALGDELGLTRRLLKRQTGDLLNASDMLAARHLLVKSGERMTEMAKQIRDGEQNPAFLIKFRRQMAIHAGIQMQAKSAQTEIARALQAFNIPAGARTPEIQADMALDMLKATGGQKEAIKLAKGLLIAQESGGSAAVHKYALKGYLAKANGVFQEVYVNGLLSWTKTHIKNFVATPLFMAYQLPEELLAGAIGGIERGVRRAVGARGVEEGVFMGQTMARAFGWSRSLSDAFVTMNRTFKTENPADALNKVEGAQLKAIDAENLNISGKPGQFVDALGRAIRIPGRALMGADDFWRVSSQRGELYSEAYAQSMRAKALGKTDEEAFDNFSMSILDPRSYAGQLDEAARYNTMTTNLGFIGDAANAMHRKLPFFGRMLMPFVTAPTNSILRFAERAAPYHAFTKDPVKRQRAIARAMITWGVMYKMNEYATEGRLTGAMPKDARQRDMLPPGWQPYSLVFRGDDFPVDADGDPRPLFDPKTGAPNGALTYVSYAGLEPVGAIIGIAATTAERMRRSNDAEVSLSLASAAVGSAVQYITEMPMLQTVGSIVESIDRGDMSYILQGPLKSGLPYSAALRAGETAVDPTSRRPSGAPKYYTIADVQNPDVVPYRDLGNGKTEVRYEMVGRIIGGGGAMFDDAMAKWDSMLSDRVLFGGADDATSAVRYDVFGKPKENNVRFDVNPVRAAWNIATPFSIKKGEALNALQREQIRLKGPLRPERKASKGFRFNEAFRAQWTDTAKNKIMTMSPAGKAETFTEALNNLVSSVNYARMDDDEQFRALRDVEDRFYESALPVMLSREEYEGVRKSYEDMIAVRGQMKEQGVLRR